MGTDNQFVVLAVHRFTGRTRRRRRAKRFWDVDLSDFRQVEILYALSFYEYPRTGFVYENAERCFVSFFPCDVLRAER